MESLEKVTDENFVPTDKKKKVGSYILGRTIGEGSFAKVRQGFHIIAKEKVAVKVVPKKALLAKESVRRNVRREAIVLQKIQHPNIVRMYEVMETENGYYLVLESVEGGEFIKYLCMKKFLPEFECRKFARQLVSAVDHLHRSNIVHRDLKLENFLLDKDLNLKIIDFGLSNVFYGDSSLVTQCGSPAYAAPEIFSNQKYGPAVDIWSVGVCLYAMLVGALPFIPDSPNNLSQLHSLLLKGCEIPDGLSQECADILTRMLTADDRKRIKMDALMIHPWLLDSHDLPVQKYPTVSQLGPLVPQSAVMNYMTKMFNFHESDIIFSLHERKVNSVAATYHLIHKRFEAGLHLIGLGMDPSFPQRKSHTFTSFPLSFPGQETSIPRSNGYVKETVDKGLSNQGFQPSSYKNYLQFLKDAKTKPLILSKQGENVILRKKGPRMAVSQQYKTNSNKSSDQKHPAKDFMLSCQPKQAVYEWSADGVVSYDTPEVPKNIPIIKKNIYERFQHVNGQSASTYIETPPPPPNTSLGGRAKTEIEINNVLQEREMAVPKTSPAGPRPGSVKTPYRYSLRTLTEPQSHEESEQASSFLSDPYPEELWGMTGKSRQRLVRGAALTLSRTKTIYANSISSQKMLTPRDAMPTLDDIKYAKIVGRGRVLLDKSTTKMLSSGISDYTKPKTAGLVRQRLPEVPSSALSRAKSDLGIYGHNNNSKGSPEPSEYVHNEKSPSPVEFIIAEDEAPMMRIRITTCSKS
ncbi:serine/threonine-protein kinase MARK2-like [Mytilus trossulus]|uniref:serine/threonine-protein kinase MARK2-like n=1 Tax=Mytilus trossulus TaxID=6551 RepID=UPI00300739A3